MARGGRKGDRVMITEEASSEVDETARPRTIYLETCARIAATFADRGFKYAKSGPRISRQEGDWKQTISFGSSRDNVPGAHVALWIYAELCNSRLKKWRATHGSHRENSTYHDTVAIGQIGNISPPFEWLEWE